MALRFVLRRAAGLLRHRRFFLASLGPIALYLSLMLGAIVFVNVQGLLGEAHDPDQARASFGEPGAPPLAPWEAFSIVGTFSGLSSGPPLLTTLESGIRGVSLVQSGCNDDPPEKQERNPNPAAFVTIHTSEEMAGVEAVCRYHNSLWHRIGYHYYVGVDGTTVQTLPHATRPYAQKSENAGVTVVLQGFARVGPTEAQLEALRGLLRALKAMYPSLQPGDLYGHRDWSNHDQQLLREGRWRLDPALANDHTDPAPASRWEDASPPRWGLPALFADTASGDGSGAVVAPAALGTYAVPELAVRTKLPASATYYLPTGRPTASGDAYDGKSHTAAVWLLLREQLADDDPRVKDCHDSPSLGRVICPALRFGTAARLCRQDKPFVCTRVLINDEGLMPSGGLDLSPLAFQELGPLREGRIAVVATIVGYLRP